MKSRSFQIDSRAAPWDSRVMGVRCNEITGWVSSSEHLSEELDYFEAQCGEAEIRFTSVRIDPSDFQMRKALELHEYRQVEIVYRISSRLPHFPRFQATLGESMRLRIASSNDLEDLKKIAKEEFKHGRFFEDLQISNDVAMERNSRWVEDLFKGEMIYVLEDSASRIVGFQAFRKSEAKAVEMILGGISANYAHKAYGFWNDFLIALNRSLDVRSVRTTISAANLPVVNLYTVLGFSFNEVLIGYHKDRRLNDPVQ